MPVMIGDNVICNALASAAAGQEQRESDFPAVTKKRALTAGMET